MATKNLLMTGERFNGALTELIPSRGFCSFVSLTVPKLKKNPLGKIVKLAKVSTVLGASYTSLVNKRLTTEQWERAEATGAQWEEPETFEAKPRQWGVKKGNFVYHTPKGETTEKVYLDCPILSVSSLYFEDGKEIDPAILAPYMPAKSSRQGADEPIIWATYELANIHLFRANGKLWVRPERIRETFSFLPEND